jgi:ubiquinone/menaquinone biosynthesis C-methylase UbiE
MDNRQEILHRFGQQADRFERRGSSLANKEYVRWAASLIELRPDRAVLDVAGGTGLLARAVASGVRSVTVLDLTPAMMAQGRSAVAVENITNVHFLRADATQVPFRDASFDIAMTRFSFHHFPEPQTVVREMARVVRPGGQVAVTDLIAHDSPAVAREHNRLERLRDPSHVRAFSSGELERLLTEAGLRILRTDISRREVDLDDWLALAAPPADAAQQIRSALENELRGGLPTGMAPLMRDRLMFTQTAMALLATCS